MIVIISCRAHSDNGSFILNKEESAEVHKILSHNEHISKKKDAKKRVRDVKISGIFYTDDDDWIVWIDGKSYSSIGQQADFSIDAVSAEMVTLTFQDGRTISLTVDDRSDIDDQDAKRADPPKD
jgi:hypothetical protein